MKVFPTPVFIRLLLDMDLFGESVSTNGAGAPEQFPAARVLLLNDRTPQQPWTTAVAQVDVYGDDELATGDLAFVVAERWRTGILPGVYAGSRVERGWVESLPRPFPDPETHAARYLMELGLVIT